MENIVDAVRSSARSGSAARRARPHFDFFERASVWDSMPDRFRLHALATQHAADRIANEIGYANRDRLIVTACCTTSASSC